METRSGSQSGSGQARSTRLRINRPRLLFPPTQGRGQGRGQGARAVSLERAAGNRIRSSSGQPPRPEWVFMPLLSDCFPALCPPEEAGAWTVEGLQQRPFSQVNPRWAGWLFTCAGPGLEGDPAGGLEAPYVTSGLSFPSKEPYVRANFLRPRGEVGGWLGEVEARRLITGQREGPWGWDGAQMLVGGLSAGGLPH